jgi:hypothetical protein
MLTLATTNTIAGVGSVASQLTCTIMGMELNGTTEVYKILDQRQLAAAAATIYTVPASTTTFVKSITVVNNDTSVRTFRLFLNGTAAANAITPLYEIQPGGQAVYEDGAGWTFYTANGIMLNGAVCLDLYQTAFFVTGCKAETFPRMLVPEVNTALLSTGRLSLEAIAIRSGELITSISFWSATTAAGTPTNQLFGLYDNNLNLLRATNNDTTTAWGANTRKRLNLTSTFTTTYTGLYYLGIMVTATTVPTVKGYTARTGGQLNAAAPSLGGTSTTGLTTSLPTPAAAPGTVTTSVWGCVN